MVRNITAGVNIGVGEGKTDTQKTLSDALAGMDDALLKVVEANKVALQKLTDGGASFEESSVKKGLKELEAFEAVQSSSDPIKEQWKSILDNIPRGVTETGAQVAETLSARAREAQVAMRSSREAGLKAMHTMTQNYATLVSGVLIGLSEVLEQGKKTKLGHLRSRLEKRTEKVENKPSSGRYRYADSGTQVGAITSARSLLPRRATLICSTRKWSPCRPGKLLIAGSRVGIPWAIPLDWSQPREEGHVGTRTLKS